MKIRSCSLSRGGYGAVPMGRLEQGLWPEPWSAGLSWCGRRLARFRMSMTGIPLLNTILLPRLAGTRSPGVRIPTRFRGSQAETTAQPPSDFLASRRDSTASGSANCSPVVPATNLPPRISPRASILLRVLTRSLHRGTRGSRPISSAHRTP